MLWVSGYNLSFDFCSLYLCVYEHLDKNYLKVQRKHLWGGKNMFWGELWGFFRLEHVLLDLWSGHQQGAVELPWLYFGWAHRTSIFISSQWLIKSSRVDKKKNQIFIQHLMKKCNKKHFSLLFFFAAAAAGPRCLCGSAGCDNCKDLWCWNLTNISASTFALSSARPCCF